MKSIASIYGVQLNDKRRDGSTPAEVYAALKAHEMAHLKANLGAPTDHAILVFGDSIFAGAMLPQSASAQDPEVAEITARVNAWWRDSEQASALKEALGLPDHLAPRLATAEADIPEMA